MPKQKIAAGKDDIVSGKMVDGGKRLRLAELPRRVALDCTPEELIATSWE
jgi:hypothetical protein